MKFEKFFSMMKILYQRKSIVIIYNFSLIRQNLITKAQDRSDRYYITAFTTQQKDAASNSKGLKPSAADVKIYRDKNVLLYMYNDLKNKLRDPELKKFINDNID